MLSDSAAAAVAEQTMRPGSGPSVLDTRLYLTSAICGGLLLGGSCVLLWLILLVESLPPGAVGGSVVPRLVPRLVRSCRHLSAHVAGLS